MDQQQCNMPFSTDFNSNYQPPQPPNVTNQPVSASTNNNGAHFFYQNNYYGYTPVPPTPYFGHQGGPGTYSSQYPPQKQPQVHPAPPVHTGNTMQPGVYTPSNIYFDSNTYINASSVSSNQSPQQQSHTASSQTTLTDAPMPAGRAAHICKHSYACNVSREWREAQMALCEHMRRTRYSCETVGLRVLEDCVQRFLSGDIEDAKGRFYRRAQRSSSQQKKRGARKRDAATAKVIAIPASSGVLL